MSICEGRGFRAAARSVTRVVVAVLAAAAVAACAPPKKKADSTLDGVPSVQAKPVAVAIEKPKAPDWRPYFKDVSRGAIRVDLTARRLTYWEPGGETARTFTIAVPRDRSLQRTGRTRIVRRRVGPDWRPTPSMLKRNPKLPSYVPPGPRNPLGEYALYLGWRYYAIHGTNNQRSVGRRATSGCFRLRSDDIEWLFSNASVGTPVLVQGKVSGPRHALPEPKPAETAALSSTPKASVR
ncbi:MAG: L,D-transpeptidase [Neomegalonema sp.]|nr:L,D-transpeptidase [Neomegalonema sp.]